jgi:hypothetical protein
MPLWFIFLVSSLPSFPRPSYQLFIVIILALVNWLKVLYSFNQWFFLSDRSIDRCFGFCCHVVYIVANRHFCFYCQVVAIVLVVQSIISIPYYYCPLNPLCTTVCVTCPLIIVVWKKLPLAFLRFMCVSRYVRWVRMSLKCSVAI